VGFSFPGPQGSGRAILWQNNVPIDLNTLIPKDSPWYLLSALSINDDGEIVGYGTINANVHAFLATPCDRAPAGAECGEDVEHTAIVRDQRATEEVVSESTREQLPQGDPGAALRPVFGLTIRQFAHIVVRVQSRSHTSPDSSIEEQSCSD
jgi:hypothetical protein